MGSLSLRTGELDLLVKPTLKHGPLKDAPLVQVSGVIERPVTRLATDEAKAESKPVLERLPTSPLIPKIRAAGRDAAQRRLALTRV